VGCPPPSKVCFFFGIVLPRRSPSYLLIECGTSSLLAIWFFRPRANLFKFIYVPILIPFVLVVVSLHSSVPPGFAVLEKYVSCDVY